MRRTALRRISARRLAETGLYRYRIGQFLPRHPYCQVWLAEQGMTEEMAIAGEGVVALPGGEKAIVPLATQVHHMNKRRDADLLDQAHWLAVSAEAHRRIEGEKAWARAQGYLRDF